MRCLTIPSRGPHAPLGRLSFQPLGIETESNLKYCIGLEVPDMQPLLPSPEQRRLRQIPCSFRDTVSALLVYRFDRLSSGACQR